MNEMIEKKRQIYENWIKIVDLLNETTELMKSTGDDWNIYWVERSGGTAGFNRYKSMTINYMIEYGNRYWAEREREEKA